MDGDHCRLAVEEGEVNSSFLVVVAEAVELNLWGVVKNEIERE